MNTPMEYLMRSRLSAGLFCIIFMLMNTFSACERDFANPNAPLVDDIPVPSLVTGVEAGMRIDYAIYLRAVSTVGREAYYFEPADPRYTGELLHATPDPGGFLLNRPWAARYRTIANCNILLERAAQTSGESAAGIEGFAKTILAYQLLLNLNYLHDNGIKLDYTGNLAVPFATRDEGFQAISDLLDEGNTALGNAGDAFPFALTSGFAGFDTPATFAQFNRGLKARVSVYRGMFNDALTALSSSFLNAGGDINMGVYHLYGSGLGDQDNEIYETPTAAFVKFRAHPSFATDMTTGDNRFSQKVLVRPDLTDVFDELSSNLVITITSGSFSSVPIMRNEELILLRAEANIGLGMYATAEGDLNIVRAAAGLGGYSGTDATNALDRLLYEKRYSLFGEGHRWVDMRRYNRLDQLPIDRPARDDRLVQMPVPEDEIGGG